jgi:hypothetical protein
MSDKILFGTDEWAKRLCEELNNSKAYAEAAKTWEGDIYFVVEAKGSALTEDRYVYLDLWHGECRSAQRAANKDDFKPEFEFRGSVKTFKEVDRRWGNLKKTGFVVVEEAECCECREWWKVCPVCEGFVWCK